MKFLKEFFLVLFYAACLSDANHRIFPIRTDPSEKLDTELLQSWPMLEIALSSKLETILVDLNGELM